MALLPTVGQGHEAEFLAHLKAEHVQHERRRFVLQAAGSLRARREIVAFEGITRTQNECSETKACGLMMFVQSHVSWWIDLAI